MKTTRYIITLTALIVAAFRQALAETMLPAPMPEFMNSAQLARWWDEKSTRAASGAAHQPAKSHSNGSDAFYTGKAFDSGTGDYLFMFRSYDPELSRWITADPTGFPDGSNNYKYVSEPISSFDYLGAFSLSTTSPLVSDITDIATGTHHATAWDLIPVPAGSSAAQHLQGLIGGNASLGGALDGSVTVSGFEVRNVGQDGTNQNVASVSLTLKFNDAISGFGWIQMQRYRLPGQSNFSSWALDISSGTGPEYSAGPIMHDIPDVGIFSQGDGERQLYTFAAVNDTGSWTIHDGIFWGGEVYE